MWVPLWMLNSGTAPMLELESLRDFESLLLHPRCVLVVLKKAFNHIPLDIPWEIL